MIESKGSMKLFHDLCSRERDCGVVEEEEEMESKMQVKTTKAR